MFITKEWLSKAVPMNKTNIKQSNIDHRKHKTVHNKLPVGVGTGT